MRFPYRSYDVEPWPANRSGKVWCPELEVIVGGMGDDASRIPLWGLVDVGAAECILPYEVADLVKATPFGDGGFVLDYSGRPHSVQYAGVYLEPALETVGPLDVDRCVGPRSRGLGLVGEMRLPGSFLRDIRRT